MSDKQRLASIKHNLIPNIHTLGLELDIRKSIVSDIRFLTEQAQSLENAVKWGQAKEKEAKQLRKQLEALY